MNGGGHTRGDIVIRIEHQKRGPCVSAHGYKDEMLHLLPCDPEVCLLHLAEYEQQGKRQPEPQKSRSEGIPSSRIYSFHKKGHEAEIYR